MYVYVLCVVSCCVTKTTEQQRERREKASIVQRANSASFKPIDVLHKTQIEEADRAVAQLAPPARRRAKTPFCVCVCVCVLRLRFATAFCALRFARFLFVGVVVCVDRRETQRTAVLKQSVFSFPSTRRSAARWFCFQLCLFLSRERDARALSCLGSWPTARCASFVRMPWTREAARCSPVCVCVCVCGSEGGGHTVAEIVRRRLCVLGGSTGGHTQWPQWQSLCCCRGAAVLLCW